jgi:lysophospholipase L1-like esterase
MPNIALTSPSRAWPVALLTLLLNIGSLTAFSADADSSAETRAFTANRSHGAPGWTIVTPESWYDPDSGWGFEKGATLHSDGPTITSESPFRFSVRLPEGVYRVRVGLGRDDTDSVTTIKAEARRLMLEQVPVAKGQTVLREFLVHIRTPQIAEERTVKLKQREKDNETVTWDDRLTLEFNGEHPGLRSLEIMPAPESPVVYLAGDSTVCDQPDEPWNSWGQMLPVFFKPTVAVANYAQSGESIKSSLGARRFEKIFSQIRPGDWLLLQFGHNDMKDKAVDALAAYRSNLKRLIAETRAHNATPILVTSMERKAGAKAPTLKDYPDTVRSVAMEDNVALVDLNTMSVTLYHALGDQLGTPFQDGSHHNNYGSRPDL